MAITTVHNELIAVNAISGTLIADNAITATHIATNAVSGIIIADNGITTVHIAENNVTSTSIVANAITSTQLADNAVIANKIPDGTIATVHLTDVNVTTGKIANDAVTLAKMAGITRGSIIIGNSGGDPAALAIGTNDYVLTSDGTDIAWEASTHTDTTKLPLAGGTMTGNTRLNDNVRHKYGSGDYFQVYHDGTNANITNGGGHLTIDLTIADKDFIVKGTDGSTDITALTLDMSDAGKAIFTGAATIGGTLGVTGAITSTATTALTLDLAGTHANGNYLRMAKGGSVQFFLGASDSVGGGSGFYDHYAISGIGQRFWTGAAERVRIDSSGNLALGHTTTTGAKFAICDGGNSQIQFFPEISTDTNLTQHYDPTASAYINAETRAATHAWKIGTSEIMRITSGGDIVVGMESVNINTNTDGMQVNTNATNKFAFTVSNQGDAYYKFGMQVMAGSDDNSGTNQHISFLDGDFSPIGLISSTGGTVSYGTFTAYHPCIVPEADNDESSGDNAYPYGTLLEIISLSYAQKNGADTERGILYNVQKSQSANSKKVLGAYGNSENGGVHNETNRHHALILGDGHILCNNSGGNIEIGDGICTSSTAGIGMKATATPSMIIGIAQEDVTFSGSETKLVAVQYGVTQFTPWS